MSAPPGRRPTAPSRRPNVGVAPESGANAGVIFRFHGLPVALPLADGAAPTVGRVKGLDALWISSDSGSPEAAELLRTALDRKVPLLATAGGFHLLNRVLGGVDRPLSDGERLEHRQRQGLEQPHHPVEVRPGSLLARCIGAGQVMVNSSHPETLNTLGRGLAVDAAALDGVVEAVAVQGHPFAIGLQWEPDRLLAAVPLHRGLFEGLMSAAREFQDL